MKSRSQLHTLLKDPKTAIVAEIGCAEGYFSADICRWGIKKLYMVDNWHKIEGQKGDGNFENDWHNKNYNDAMERVAGFNVEVLRGISWNMADKIPDNSLDLVYIDCCHMYECVVEDLKAYYPKVKSGGIVAGHDINNTAYGVERAVHEFCNSIGQAVNIIPEHGIDASFYFFKP